jgi:hypothetical protein
MTGDNNADRPTTRAIGRVALDLDRRCGQLAEESGPRARTLVDRYFFRPAPAPCAVQMGLAGPTRHGPTPPPGEEGGAKGLSCPKTQVIPRF